MDYFKNLAGSYNGLSSMLQGAYTNANEDFVDISKKASESLQGAGNSVGENAKHLTHKTQGTYNYVHENTSYVSSIAQNSINETYNYIQSNLNHVSNQAHSSLRSQYNYLYENAAYASCAVHNSLKGTHHGIEKNVVGLASSTNNHLKKSLDGSYYYSTKEAFFGKKFAQYEQEAKDLEAKVYKTRKSFEACLQRANKQANSTVHNSNNEGLISQQDTDGETSEELDLIMHHNKYLPDLISGRKVAISRQIKAARQAKFEEMQVKMTSNMMKGIFYSALASAKFSATVTDCFTLSFVAGTVAKSIGAHNAAE